MKKSKKFIIAGLLVISIFTFSTYAQAATLTNAQIQSIINLLSVFGADQATINDVETALTGKVPATNVSQGFCYDFSQNLTIGMSGSSITALQTALQKEGQSVFVSGTFDEATASAVSGFQEKYRSSVLTPVGLYNGTGYVGPSTRAKLNALYTCGSSSGSQLSPPSQQNALPIEVSEKTSELEVITPQGGSYKPGDTIHISWKPVLPGVQTITFLPTGKGSSATIYSDRVNGDPVNTKGFYEYKISDHFPASGSYVIKVSNLKFNPRWTAVSKTPFTVTAKPTLFFGNTSGQNNSVSISSGESQTLKWQSTSATSCFASSVPQNSNWSGKVTTSGTRTIDNFIATQNFYLVCNNSLGSVTGKFTVNVIMLDPSIDSTFSSQQYSQSYDSRVTSSYVYKINNYREGLVLDVEPTVNCDDTYIKDYKRDCSQYLFSLSGKAVAENYTGVKGNPYVKGGASYRFSGGADGQLNINGFINSLYVAPSGYMSPVPDSLGFKFILRDTTQGGKEVWSEIKRIIFKG